jgi:hypothetical protein
MWRMHGGRKIALRDLELLGDCLYLPHMQGDQARRWVDALRVLIDHPVAGWARCEKRFLGTCARIEALYEMMTAMNNRELLHTFYRFVWELKEESMLLRRYLAWRKSGSPGTAVFTSGEHRPGIYRGGLIAELQRMLPMDEQGGFSGRTEPSKARFADERMP